MKTKQNTLKKKLIALSLCLSLIAGFFPVTASAQEAPYIFGYQAGGGSIISVSTTDQSDRTKIADYDASMLGLEMIGDTIYALSSDHSFITSSLYILNPDFTIQRTVGMWINTDFVITDTTVQNDTLWGTYNDENLDSYLIPISLTTGKPEKEQKHEITGLPENEIVYTIACDASGKMYAIVADGRDNGGAASLYTIDTNSFAATEVGSTGMKTNYISTSTFAPDGTLYWAENDAEVLYTVDTSTGLAKAVSNHNIPVLNAMMIPSNGNRVAYVNFTVKGEKGSIIMGGEQVTGLQEFTAGSDLELTFTPGENNRVKEVRLNGEKQEVTGNAFSLKNVKSWGQGIQTVEVTFQSKDISITPYNNQLPYQGKDTLNYHPTFEATLYFTVDNGPTRNTAGVSNYDISIEKDGTAIAKSDLVPGTYDIHVTREADEEWNALDTVLEDGLTITKCIYLPLFYDLELTAEPGDTLADIEKPTYLVSSLDGKQIPGTFYWKDDESTSVGNLGDRTGFTFRFKPDLPLSEELAALYDFSTMPENGFDGPFTAYVTVEENETPGIAPISLPVRTIEKEDDVDYIARPNLSASFRPNVEVNVGNFNEFQGLAIDYYHPMADSENYMPVSTGYDAQVEYSVSIPLADYDGETLSGILTVPLPEGYDGASARIKGGAAASSHTATTVSFPVTLDISNATAEKLGLLVEYKKAQAQPQPNPPGVVTPTTYAITVPDAVENGTVSVSPSRAAAGSTVTVTATPDEGYVLDALTITDSSGKAIETEKISATSYRFTMPNGAVEIEAAFVKENAASFLPFSDVDEDDWFYDAVTFAYNNGIMTGTSATTFEPNTTTTRGMIVAILNRLEGSPTAASAGFNDVAEGDWYADAVNWAASVGVVNGMGEGIFAPNAAITREQMAAILYNYAAYKGYDVSDRADISGYSDADQVSAWAEEAVQWAVAEGIIAGVTIDTLDAQGSATRAQVAAIFQRFLSE